VTHILAGKRILVVEDGPFIAQNLAFELVRKGAEVIEPVSLGRR
jgi:hypothetical protein